jgi:uncharacterized protein (UPF0548 family)
VPNRDSRLVERFRGEPFTYSEVGATALIMPTDAHHVRRSELIGQGALCFSTAADVLMSWEMHRRAGLRVTASSSRATPDATVVMRIGVGFGPVVPCRVVYIITEDRRIGFAYGTLLGHPESGEEAFVVELLPDDQVRVQITAFSRPARWYSRLGGPAALRAQAIMTERYVRALQRAAA